MQKLFTLLILVSFVHPSFGQDSLRGHYQTNFPALGMFTESIDLKPDSSFEWHFWGDLLYHEVYYGTWTLYEKQLSLTIDSTRSPSRRYKSVQILNVKGRRLYPKRITRAEYAALKKKISVLPAEKGSAFKLPSYSQFQETPTNFQGGSAVQYFRKMDH